MGERRSCWSRRLICVAMSGMETNITLRSEREVGDGNSNARSANLSGAVMKIAKVSEAYCGADAKVA